MPGIDGGGLFAAQTRSVPAIFPAVSFLLPFPHLVDMNRGLFFLHKVRSPTQLPSGSLKPALPIYTTILRKMVRASFLDAPLKILYKFLFGLKQLPT